MNEPCLICDRIRQIKDNTNPYFVKELETGYVVMGDYQFFKGYTLFLSKIHTDELHKLDLTYRDRFLHEMAVVGEAVFKVFQPRKLNYELLGNTDKHLHWHIFPRYQDDPSPSTVTWVVEKKIRYSEEYKPTHQELEQLREQLLFELERLLV